MKIIFKFDNGTSQLILTPETPRDKMYLDLCMDGKREIVFKPTKEDCTIIEFRSVENSLPTQSLVETFTNFDKDKPWKAQNDPPINES